MKRFLATLASMAIVATVAVVGCGQAPPSPTPAKPGPAPTAPPAATAAATKALAPTEAPAAATKALAPTQAPAAATAPAKRVDYPEKGKNIRLIIPWPAGGTTDVNGRLLVPLLEAGLGVPVQVENKGGAGSQVGVTELAKSKPDGYTLGYINLPMAITFYLDPERQAAYVRKDLQPIANHMISTGTISVKADSPYKSMKDLVDAAKAKPDKITLADPAPMTLGHLQSSQLQQLSGAKFALVHLEGGTAGMSRLIGGHVEAASSNVDDSLQYVRNGEVRILGVSDSQRSELVPDVKTMEEQGYKMYWHTTYTLAAPGGTPKEIVDRLSSVVKKATEDPAHMKKLEEMGRTLRYMDTAQFEKYWTEREAELGPVLEIAKATQK